MGKKQKHYVVWKGRKTGIFSSWEECSAQVTSFVGAEYMAFDTLAEAQEALRGGYADYKGKHVSHLSQQRLAVDGSPILASYCVDAACTSNPGPVEYRCVHTKTRQEIFREGPFGQGTNNIGEFLAIVHALALFKRDGITLPIYSDSKNALSWVLNEKCKTRLARNEQNAKLFALIERAEKWLATNEYANQILKWKTEDWGEIPADFGRK